MKSKIKSAVDYFYKNSDILAVPLFLWTVFATAYGTHKLDWIDASFLILYTFVARERK
jgi:hypothetical protein